jgi:hypothetical protein
VGDTAANEARADACTLPLGKRVKGAADSMSFGFYAPSCCWSC